MKNLKKIVAIGGVISIMILLLDIVISKPGRSSIWGVGLLSGFAFSMFYVVIILLSNDRFFKYYNIKSKYKSIYYKLLIGSTLSVFISLLSLFFLRFSQKVILEGIILETFFLTEENNSIFYLIALFLTLIVSVFYIFQKHRERQVKEQKVIAGVASAQFDALKNQLDPHFLFNSLNVLTSLIEENPEAAQQFTTALSKIYRYVLEQKNKELVSVDEELQFAKTYVKLLKMRFEDSIVFTIPEQSTNPDAKVVPLSLQLLLENAVKHNTAKPSNPLQIKIHEQGGELLVENNLQTKEVLKKGSGVGLNNIQSRYALLTKRKVIINQTASKFVVQLPMLTKQVSIMEIQEEYIEDKRYYSARQRVKEIKGFYMNLLSYVIVMPLLFLFNYNQNEFSNLWAIYPLLGWGLGISIHAIKLFVPNLIVGSDWEERKINEIMNTKK